MTHSAAEISFTATDCEVKNAILTILGRVDGSTTARLLEESEGQLRAALAATPR